MKSLSLRVLAWWAAVHRHIHLSLVDRRLESPHILGRNRLDRPVRHGLLTRLHLSRVIVLLLRANLFSRHAKDKAVYCATLVMPHVPQIWLRSDCAFLVMCVRLMPLHWQRLHAGINMLRRHHWHLGRCLCWSAIQMLVDRLLTLVNAGSLPWRCTVEIWHFCLNFLFAVLRRHRHGRSLRLFRAVVVIVKVIVMIVWVILKRWSYRCRIRSGEILVSRLASKSRLLRGGVESSG